MIECYRGGLCPVFSMYTASGSRIPCTPAHPSPQPSLSPELHTDHLVILELVSPERSVSDRLSVQVQLPPLPQTHVFILVCSNQRILGVSFGLLFSLSPTNSSFLEHGKYWLFICLSLQRPRSHPHSPQRPLKYIEACWNPSVPGDSWQGCFPGFSSHDLSAQALDSAI